MRILLPAVSFAKFKRSLGILVSLVCFSIAAFAQAPAVSEVNRFTIKSAVLGEDRVILVRTPAGYETNKVAYPVLYMTDGDAHVAHTSSTVEFLARNGRMSELIVVGIVNTDRTRDLTPTKSILKTPTGEVQFPTAGGGDNFLKFIETELIPEVEKRYRVQPYRALAGHSLGGLFTVHAMLARPELFNSYVAVSPSMQWADSAEIKRAEEFLKGRKEMKTTFFMSLGHEPGAISTAFDQFKQVLTKYPVKGLDWEAQSMPDEDHGSVVLRSHYYGLRKIYDGWLLPRDQTTGAIAGGLKGADEHYKKMSAKFGYAIATPENLINQMGYQALFAKQNDEAIAIFKANIERYPDSANVYDSLAEAYETTGHMDLAAPLYEKASALGRKNSDPNTAIYETNFKRSSEKLRQAEAEKKNPAEAIKKGQ